MTLKNKQLVLHPFLFVIFPVLSLYAGNVGQVPFGDVARALVFALTAAGGVLALLRLGLGDWQRAGLITSLGAMLFFSFGSVYRLAEKLVDRRPAPLLLVWGGLMLGGAWMIVHRLRGSLRRTTRMLNIIGAIALASCLYGFGAAGVHAAFAPTRTPTIPAATLNLAARPSSVPSSIPNAPVRPASPDIYYIILDGHIRADVLKEIYGVDETPFIQFLRQRGFTVAAGSHSNYGQTALSLASSLNFGYITPPSGDTTSADRAPLIDMINTSAAASFLKEQGYTTVAFDNGFSGTELTQADHFVQDPNGLNNFEISLLTGSVGSGEIEPQIVDSYRQRVQWEAEALKQVVDGRAGVGGPEISGPKFVFAHFILPHPPFVFNADGSARTPGSLESADGSQYTGLAQDYIDGYREQVQYADQLAEQLIAYIQDHSKNPPVIILQGDHGSGLFLDWSSSADSCLRERFSVLNAYYLPGKNAAALLYPSITPVNSFRVVLDAYFNAGLPRLPDRTYYSPWDHPYEFEDISGKMTKRCGG